MKRNNWIVTEESERPARKDGTCFYCGVPIGGEHKSDCLIRRRTCVVEFTFRVVTDEPESWTPDDIEFHYNESSWCCDNILSDINDRGEKLGCCCGIVEAKYIGEATELDEESYGMVFVKDANS